MMKKSARRILSVLLVLVMVLSHADLSFAQNLGSDAPAEAASNEETADGSITLEMEDLDPSTLGIKKLGVTEEEEEPDPENLTPDTSLEQTVRVSIFLEGKSAIDAGYSTNGIGTNQSAISYRDALKAKQTEMTARIESLLGRELEVKWNLTLLTNAISTYVKVKEIPLIERLDGVISVEREMHYEAPVTDSSDDPQTANTSANMVGAQNAWYQLGYTGAGSKVAIIDTGLDTTHQSMDADAFMYAINAVGKADMLMTQSDLNAIPTSQLNSGSHNYLNAKIPYAYNYVDGGTRVDHKDAKSNHGSHVAGIAAANRYIKNGSNYEDAADTVKAVGMAPDAQILVMKVFGNSGGAYDSDYFAALEDAIVLGVDAANLSLGSGSPGFTYASTSYQKILNGLVNNTTNNHLVLCISAGNSYSADSFTPHALYAEDASFHTGGSPGSFLNSMGVAAAKNTLTEGTPLIFNGEQKVFYAESTKDSDGNTYTNPEISTIKGTYDYVYIDATGEASDYSAVNSAVSLSGKIVIVNRGDISFSEKGNNAKTYSPKAVVVANNTDGTIYMNLADYTGTFPMVSITLKDANLIKSASTAKTAGGITYYTGRVEVTTDKYSVLFERSDAEISDFSAWGVPGSLIMKPEITAPGENIYSLNGTSTASSDADTGPTSYVSYDGTSMAAPHITGISAVLMQYLKEKEPANAELVSAYSLRAIAQSLLMSTATPMINNDAYLSILQQGSGLAEVSKAIEAKSVVMMDEAYLTTDTNSAADGKVKVELGDDPAKKGEYDFKFTIYNISDETLEFELDTDLFTQAVAGDTLSHKTALLPSGGVTYEWDGVAPTVEEHDVDMDGDTDEADAQAILDYLTGEIETIDEEAADLDGDEIPTSYDAYLLLLLLQNPSAPVEGYVVAAHEQAQVTVHIRLTAAQKETLEKEGGAWLEGYTYVTCVNATREGESLEHEHTIPILGYYGSWTDASMFDTNSYTESLYGNEQKNYSKMSAGATNYMTITTNGTTAKFSGNPYTVEEEFPEDRLAIRSDATINNIYYNLIRSAAGTGFAVTTLDEEGEVDSIVTSVLTATSVTGLWYYVNEGTWQNTGLKFYSVNKKLKEYNSSDISIGEGDRVRVGFYAIPEYNAMLHSDDMTAANAGTLTASKFTEILTSSELGKGAFMGFDFTVDDSAPEIGEAVLNGSQLSVSASDNLNLAYVAVLSLDGSEIYAEAAPGKDTYTVSFDASDAIANARGYVAVFAGDYAGNEKAMAVRVNDNAYEDKIVYLLTDTLAANNDYLIVDRNSAGSGYALGHSGTTVATNSVTVKAADTSLSESLNKPYIDSADVASTSIWTASSGIKLMNGNYYLRRNSNTGTTLQVNTTNSYNTWQYSNNQLRFTDRATYLRYSSGFSLTTSASNIYLYQKTTVRVAIDPDTVTGISLTPSSLDLYKGDTADLTAKATPITAIDRTVSWKSSNTSVATVDQTGHVTAVAAGSAVITATANGNSAVTASCSVTVTAVNKTLYGIIWDEEGGVYFSNFNASNLPTWTKNHSDDKDLPLTSAFMQSTSALYAATLDTSTATTELYTVNRTSYALTDYGTNFVFATDIAIGATTYSSYVGMVYTFGPYLVAGPIAPGDDGEGGTYTGLPYAANDFSTVTGDAYFAGIACQSRSSYGGTYYVLDENGVIWLTTLQLNSAQDGFEFTTPVKQCDTGIGTSFLYQNLYYDGTYLYWGHQDGEAAELIIIRVSDWKIFHAGNFGENVWPVTGLYTNGSVAPASVDDEGEIMGGVDLSDIQLKATRDEMLTADILARFAAEAERFASKQVSAPAQADPAEDLTEAEPVEVPTETEVPEIPAEEIEAAEETEAPTEEPETSAEEASDEEVPADETKEEAETEAEEPADPEYTGSLNLAVVTNLPERDSTADLNAAALDEDAEPGTVIVKLYEEEDAYNGLYAISYDTEYMTVTAMESSAAYKSFHKDEEKGILTFAFADTDPVAAGGDIARITFTVTSCEDINGEEDGIFDATKLQLNDDVELNDCTPLVAAGIGHDWGEAEWSWTGNDTSGYTAATATFTCANNSSHTETMDAEVYYEVTKPATTTETGIGTYTAEVAFDADGDGTAETHTDTKTVTIPKLNEEGYHIILDNRAKNSATTSLVEGQQYSGEVTFTVANALMMDVYDDPVDAGCIVAVVNSDGTYTPLACTTTTVNGTSTHSFTVSVTNADVNLILVIKGDANLDGEIDAIDTSWIKQVSLGKKELTEAQLLAANIYIDEEDEPGLIDAVDVSFIKQVNLGKRILGW